jgi:hypothetical protein
VVSKQIAAVLTIIGGVMYLLGGLFETIIYAAESEGPLAFVSTPGVSIFGSFQASEAAPASNGLNSTAVVILLLGLVTGICIIVGGALINSESGRRRKVGGILAIVMMGVGAITTLGGFVIGFIFVLTGSVLGLTYKPNSPDIVIGVPGLGSVSTTQGYEAREVGGRVQSPSALEQEILRQLPQGKSVDEVSRSTGVPANVISEKFGKLQAEGLMTADHMLTERGYNVLKAAEKNSE